MVDPERVLVEWGLGYLRREHPGVRFETRSVRVKGARQGDATLCLVEGRVRPGDRRGEPYSRAVRVELPMLDAMREVLAVAADLDGGGSSG